MKRALVIILVAFIAVASAFAFEFKSVSLDTGIDFINGFGGSSVSANMEVIDNLDVYAGIGAMAGFFEISLGAQYKVYTFEVENTDIDILPGAQIGFCFGDGFFFTMLGTCQFSFEAGHFGAFARPGIGFGIYSYDDYSKRYFRFTTETGIYYRF